MASQKLNPTFVNSLEPREKDYTVYDTEVPGFHVKVTPRGKKVYYLWYRTRDRRAGKYCLGEHGVLTPHQAREMARKLSAEIRGGADPARKLTEQKAAPTVKEACSRFREWLAAHRKPSTVKEYGRILDKWVIPLWGSMKLHGLSLERIEEQHQKMATTPYEANRLLAVLSSVMGRAMAWKLLPKGGNICADIERYPETSRGTVLNSEQMQALGTALRELAAFEPSRQAAHILFLLLFTGCRRGEVLTMKWEFIDLEHGVIRFPDTKTGQRTHTLGRGAIALLSTISPAKNSPFVFPSPMDASKPYSGNSLSGVWNRVREQAGLPHIRIHDLRHNRGSWGAKNHLGGFTLQQMLGHKTMATTQRYLHAFDEVLAEANNLLDEQFTSLLGMKVENVIVFSAAKNTA